MVEGMFSFFFVCILKITDLKCRCEVSCTVGDPLGVFCPSLGVKGQVGFLQLALAFVFCSTVLRFQSLFPRSH